MRGSSSNMAPCCSRRRVLHQQRAGAAARRWQSRSVAMASTSKDLWIKTKDKSALMTALEGGIRTAVFEDPELAEACRPLAVFTPLMQHGGSNAPPGHSIITDTQTGEMVARVCNVSSPSDLRQMEVLVQGAAESGEPTTLIMDAKDWKVIPAESLVALGQASTHTKVMAVASCAQDALTMLGALQVGVQGVVLHTESAAEVRALLTGVSEMEGPGVSLQPADVIRVEPLGQGDRVCVDVTSMLRPGEGLLVGSFARGLFLVHCECADNVFIAPRPFRVNAGAVHSYVMGPQGRTSYLTELKAGATCQVVAANGNSRTVRVGRCKLENRPLVLVEARTAGGALHSVVLQNAETVKLVCSVQGPEPPTASAAASLLSLEEQGKSTALGGKGWEAVSVSELQPGKHRVLVHVPSDSPARHTGLPVDQWVLEH